MINLPSNRNLKTASGTALNTVGSDYHSIGHSGIKIHSNPFMTTVPDLTQEFGKDIEKEKKKLNRFFEIKEQGENISLQKNERFRKQAIDKEKRLKKRLDADQREFKNKLSKF